MNLGRSFSPHLTLDATPTDVFYDMLHWEDHGMMFPKYSHFQWQWQGFYGGGIALTLHMETYIAI